ncbi:alkaline phosphatase family protein [uncultured Kordia sp.]|uniref:alkaline phosphatase family protein n=1 Tax=uncultured Kordia sp. TaxID=507699 RepID=UPI00262EB7FE|nr:alkaline phosphatase family protein [uncultured Kordia sp.]
MTPINSKIKHVVVVMFENRSFDHMLGFLYNDSYKNKNIDIKNINVSPLGHPFEGLTGNETNPDGKGGSVKVFPIDKNDKYAYYMPKMDPGEGFMNTNYQLFGASIPPFPQKIGPNQGFLLDFEGKIANKYYGDPPKKEKKTSTSSENTTTKKTYDKYYDHSKDYKNDDYKKWYKEELPPISGIKIVPKLQGTEPKDIMGMYTPELLPILSNLAKGYAVCDQYYCSVPSETLPNRAFMHLATSQGHLYDEIKRYNAPSIFKNLTNYGHTWGIFGYEAKTEPYTFTFCEDISSDTLVTDPNSKPEYILPKGCQSGKYVEFEAALKNGTLPDYTFLEPSWGSYGNSQHPNYDVSAGEDYMLKIYNAIRESDYWEDTLLIINYDEHGGCYDHVIPPTGATQPSPTTVNEPTGFKFDRFGVRVPCVLISPWIEAGTVYRTKGDVPLDHTSILKTIETLFNLPPLTARDAAASDMLDVLTLETARTDNPLEGIKPPVTNPTVQIENHASQILRAQAAALTDKRNSETGTQHTTPEFKTDEEAHAYIDQD